MTKHKLKLGQQSVEFELIRTNKKKFTISVQEHGLVIEAPVGASNAVIQATLTENQNKIMQMVQRFSLSQTTTSDQANLTPTHFEPGADNHNHAHSVQLKNGVVNYQLLRMKRKSFSIGVKNQQLQVKSPIKATIQEIEKVLIKHEKKIEQILNHFGLGISDDYLPSVDDDLFVTSIPTEDGQQIPLFGQMISVRFSRELPRARYNLSKNILTIGLSGTSTHADRTEIVLDCLGKILLDYIDQKAAELRQEHGLAATFIGLSNAKSYWGICKANQQIRLNWLLVFVPHAMVDYVLIHELAHTVHLNHSKSFWELVALICPTYKTHMTAFKQPKYNLALAMDSI